MRLLIVILALLPFWPALNPTASIDLAFVRVLVLALFLAWLAAGFARSTLRVPFTPPIIALTVFFLFAGLSAFWGEETNAVLRKTAFFFSLAPLIVLSASASRLGRERILATLVFGAAISALAGLTVFSSQFFLGHDRVTQLVTAAGPILFGASSSGAVTAFPSWFVGIGNGQALLRAFFPFPDPHTAALFWGMALGLALSPWFICKSTKRGRYTLYALRYTLLIALIATFSRGAYVALVALLIAYSIWHVVYGSRLPARRYAFYGMAGLGLLLSTSVLSAPAFSDRVASTFDFSEGSTAARLALWGQAADLFLASPFLGVGLGNYAHALDPFAPYRVPTNAHSTYLEISAELGVIGLFLFVFAVFSAFAMALKRAQRDSAAHLGIIFALVFFATHAFFEVDLYSPPNLVAFFILITLAGLEVTTIKNQRWISN